MAVLLDLRATDVNIITRQNVKMDITFIPSIDIDWSGFSFSYEVEDSDGTSIISVTNDGTHITTDGKNIRLLLPSTTMAEDSVSVGTYHHSLKLWSEETQKQEFIRGDLKVKAGV